MEQHGSLVGDEEDYLLISTVGEEHRAWIKTVKHNVLRTLTIICLVVQVVCSSSAFVALSLSLDVVSSCILVMIVAVLCWSVW